MHLANIEAVHGTVSDFFANVVDCQTGLYTTLLNPSVVCTHYLTIASFPTSRRSSSYDCRYKSLGVLILPPGTSLSTHPTHAGSDNGPPCILPSRAGGRGDEIRTDIEDTSNHAVQASIFPAPTSTAHERTMCGLAAFIPDTAGILLSLAIRVSRKASILRRFGRACYFKGTAGIVRKTDSHPTLWYSLTG